MKSTRILVVDDEEAVRDYLSNSLRYLGHECYCHADPESADRSLEESSYDLIICDIAMRGNSRLEWVREVVEREDPPPIILITGVPTAETAVAALRLSLADYLIKPFRIEQLQRSIERTLSTRKVRGSMRSMHNTLEEWSDQVGVIEQVLEQESGAGRQSMTMDRLTEMTLGRMSSMMLNLSETASQIRKKPEEAGVDLCRHLPCSHLKAHREALQDTVDVLLETKGAFKSKALAGLRSRLENLLRAS